MEEMGEVRYREMLEVEKVLKLSGMKVLDFPDSGLKELDSRILEQAVQKHIEEIMPSIVVTYPIHGVNYPRLKSRASCFNEGLISDDI